MIRYILLVFFLTSCGQRTEKNKAEKAPEAPKEWLVYGEETPNAKHIVLISGDEEYRSEEALVQLAKILATHHGFKCTVLFAQDRQRPGIVDPNYNGNIPGLEALSSADMMVIQTRFRALPDAQMQYIDDYLRSGRPVMGIRTATHAFNFDKDSASNFVHYGNYYSGDKTEWADGFGRLVLGENWINHHGEHKHQSTRGILVEGEKANPITNGLHDIDIWGSTDVYGVRLPLPNDCRPIVLGQVVDRAGAYDETDLFFGMKPSDTQVAGKNADGLSLNDPMMPIAWTKSYQLPKGKQGRAFTSTIGSATDLLDEGVRRLLVNGLFWAMDLEIPDRAKVDLVEPYSPKAYGFETDAYWLERQLKVSDLE